MNSFTEGIIEILDRRQLDIAAVKRSTILGHTSRQKAVLLQGCVLLIYAALEGGVKEMCRYYFSHISRLAPKVSELNDAYLCLATGSKCKLPDSITDPKKKLMVVSAIRNVMLGSASMPGTVNTENLSPKVLINICESLDLDPFLSNDEEKQLNQLLRFRNNIAHGDQAMPIDHVRIDSFSAIAQTILTEFAYRLCVANDSEIWLTSR